MAMTISEMIASAGATLKALGKVMLLSRRTAPLAGGGDTLIVLGNGPSLNDTMAAHADVLGRYPTLAVNFAANAPCFATLRPRYYLLADPHFFNKPDDPNVARLIDNLNKVDFDLTLFVPASVDSRLLTFDNPRLTLARFNAVGVEAPAAVERWLFDRRRAMPRPRNVLIPSLMVGVWLGFKNIYVVGADHSWLRTISVNDDNEVVSVQPHFYKEDDKEKARVVSEYKGYRLHQILFSFYVAFKSYFAIERYAKSRGVNIYNSTPGSFIDAFERRGLPSAQGQA
jgi:hypothetical protein